MRQNSRLELTPGFALLLAGLYCLTTEELFWAFLLGTGLHELGHLAVLALCGQPVRRLRLTAMGATIETGLLPYGQEFLSALAGPAADLLLFVVLRRLWPVAAVLALGLGLFNLLPIWPLDGGRALAALAGRFMSQEEGTVVRQIAAGAAGTFLVLGAASASWLLHLGIWPLLLAAWAILRAFGTARQERAFAAA